MKERIRSEKRKKKTHIWGIEEITRVGKKGPRVGIRKKMTGRVGRTEGSTGPGPAIYSRSRWKDSA